MTYWEYHSASIYSIKKSVLGAAELIDAIPEKRRFEDGGDSSSDDEEVSIIHHLQV